MPEPVYGDWSRTLEGTPQGFLAGSYENTDMHLFGPEQIAASRRAYYACITQVDYQLGRLFGALRENGLWKIPGFYLPRITEKCWETITCPKRICF